jgi:hypothetical protein
MKFLEIKVGALEEFLTSATYLKALNSPISRHRAISQARNPLADQEDVALILALDGEQIVGYIGLLPDLLNGKKVYWNSCWWVAETHKSVGLPLLFQLIKKGKEAILLTDLTPHTTAIISQLRFFDFRDMPDGIRGYLLLELACLLPRRWPGLSPLKPLLGVIDSLVNLFIKVVNPLRRSKNAPEFSVEPIDHFSDTDLIFIEQHSESETIRRSPESLIWILNNPWVLNENEIAMDYSNYHFTATAKDYQMQLLRFTVEGKIKAIALYRRLNRKAFIPYLYVEPDFVPAFTKYIYQLLLNQSCTYFTTFHPLLRSYIEKHGGPFLFRKSIKRTFAYHKKLEKDIPQQLFLQDGDGDVVFC